MKKIIAFTSLLFLFLLAVLPGQATHAAAATNPTALTGISIVTEKSGEIKAVQNGDSFTFNLYNQDGNQTIKEFRFYSNTAKTISFMPYELLNEEQVNLDDYDLQFVNGVATLDKQKLLNWYQRLYQEGQNNQDNPEDFNLEELQAHIDSLFTLKGFRENLHGAFESGQENPLYVYDTNGNETEISVTFNYGWKFEKGLGWVHYNDNGQLSKGWYNDKFADDPEADDEWYYLNPTNGVMKTGWLNVGGKWYYLQSSGLMATGWVSVNGNWYFLDKTTGAMKTGWMLYGGKWYFLKSGGDMATGWVKVGTKWYYLNSPNGDMVTGWKYINGKWYYLNSNGSMATGWVKVGTKWYYLYSDGHMAKNTKVGRYVIGADGAMK